MSITEIPRSFVYACDVCGRKHTQESPTNRPSHWALLNFEQAAEDWGGNECADASVKKLLCQDCRSLIGKAINDAASGVVAQPIDIVFDDGPGPVAGRFVEAEDAAGKSVNVGEWRKREDGYWALRISAVLPASPISREAAKGANK